MVDRYRWDSLVYFMGKDSRMEIVMSDVLTQIHNKVIGYIDKMINQIGTNSLALAALPIEQLNNMILEHYSSECEYMNPTNAFDANITATMRLLTDAALAEDQILCVRLLEILKTQLSSFVTLEMSWYYTSEYNHTRVNFDQYAKALWERKMLGRFSHEPLFVGKGVVYTAITGGYDTLRVPEYVNPELDYICFTDQEQITSDFWSIRRIDNAEGLDPIRLARRHKILCHEYLPEYDYSIWIDGQMNVIGNMLELEKYHIASSLLCVPHYERDCAYEEAETCLALGRGKSSEIEKQVQRYRAEHYPEHNGMITSGVLFRSHHDAQLRQMCETWWKEVKNESTRDQISFGYACWKTGFDYDLCNFSMYDNPYFTVEEHNQ